MKRKVRWLVLAIVSLVITFIALCCFGLLTLIYLIFSGGTVDGQRAHFESLSGVFLFFAIGALLFTGLAVLGFYKYIKSGKNTYIS